MNDNEKISRLFELGCLGLIVYTLVGTIAIIYVACELLEKL